MIIYTLSKPDAGDVSRIRKDLIRDFKKAQASEDEARRSLIEASAQDVSTTESACETQNAYCDVVWANEKDGDERMTIELSVTPIPPNEHHHGPIDSSLLPVCNRRSDWPDCRDRRIDAIRTMLLGLERAHQGSR
jgi:hypothetical protein